MLSSSTIRKLRQVDFCDFRDSLVDIASARPAKAIYSDTLPQNKQQQQHGLLSNNPTKKGEQLYAENCQTCSEEIKAPKSKDLVTD